MNGRSAGGVVTVPPFRPLMAAANNMVRNVRLAAQQQQHQQQYQQQQQQQQKQQQQQLLKPLPVPTFAALPESIAKVAVEPAQPSSFASGHRQLPTASVVTPMVGRLSAPQIMQPASPIALMQAQRQTMPSPVFIAPLQQQPQQLLSPMFMSQQPQQQQTMIISQPQPSVIMSQQPQQKSVVITPQQPQQQSTGVMPQQQQQFSPVYYHNAMQQAANRRFNVSVQNVNML